MPGRQHDTSGILMKKAGIYMGAEQMEGLFVKKEYITLIFAFGQKTCGMDAIWFEQHQHAGLTPETVIINNKGHIALCGKGKFIMCLLVKVL